MPVGPGPLVTLPSDQLALGGQRIDGIEIQIGKRANSGNSDEACGRLKSIYSFCGKFGPDSYGLPG